MLSLGAVVRTLELILNEMESLMRGIDLIFFLRFYLFIHETHTHTHGGGGAETQAEGETGSMQGSRRGPRPQDSRITL